MVHTRRQRMYEKCTENELLLMSLNREIRRMQWNRFSVFSLVHVIYAFPNDDYTLTLFAYALANGFNGKIRKKKNHFVGALWYFVAAIGSV